MPETEIITHCMELCKLTTLRARDRFKTEDTEPGVTYAVLDALAEEFRRIVIDRQRTSARDGRNHGSAGS